MTMCRRFLTGLARLSVCLALTFVTFAGQIAVSTEAAAQTSVRAYVINGTGSGTFKVGEAVAIAAGLSVRTLGGSGWRRRQSERRVDNRYRKCKVTLCDRYCAADVGAIAGCDVPPDGVLRYGVGLLQSWNSC